MNQPALFQDTDLRIGAIRARARAIVTPHMEGSANVNTNPRIEQTCLTRDRDLFEFYREFYDGIKSVYKNPYALRQSN